MVCFSRSAVDSEGRTERSENRGFLVPREFHSVNFAWLSWQNKQVHDGKPVNLGLPYCSAPSSSLQRVLGWLFDPISGSYTSPSWFWVNWLEVKVLELRGYFLDTSHIPPVLLTNKPSQSLADLAALCWNVWKLYRAAGTESKHVWGAWVLILHLLGCDSYLCAVEKLVGPRAIVLFGWHFI